MLLRASGELTGDAVDVRAVNRAGEGGGVSHGEAIVRFVEAVLGDDEAERERARAEALEALGPAGFVDACAVIATFSQMDRIADATGIPLDPVLQVATQGMRAEIGVGRFASAANTPAPGPVRWLLGKAMEPIAPVGVKLYRWLRPPQDV